MHMIQNNIQAIKNTVSKQWIIFFSKCLIQFFNFSIIDETCKERKRDAHSSAIAGECMAYKK